MAVDWKAQKRDIAYAFQSQLRHGDIAQAARALCYLFWIASAEFVLAEHRQEIQQWINDTDLTIDQPAATPASPTSPGSAE